MADPIPITLPGRPVTAQLDPDALPRYLTARGWALSPRDEFPNPYWVVWERDAATLSTPRTDVSFLRSWLSEETQRCIIALATIEGREASAVLADLLPPSSAPVAWAHLSDAARADVYRDVNGMAAQARSAAAHARDIGDTEAALRHEQRAMGHAAALAELGRRAL